MESTSKLRDLTVFEIWERTGITEHMGGTKATERLIDLCGIRPGQRVLDLGCGTGYTACRLARGEVDVVGVDLDHALLRRAQRRVSRQAVSNKVTLVQSDVQCLPFTRGAFDVAMAESVLVFCDPKKVASEAYRALKPGGRLGINELTCLQPLPEALSRLFSGLVGGTKLQVSFASEWQAVLRKAGFVDVSSVVSRIDLLEQFLSHIRVDGVAKYLAGSLQSIVDPRIRRVYFGKDMLTALLQLPRFLRFLGYGLYVGRKVTEAI